jgi:hypothetical protein
MASKYHTVLHNNVQLFCVNKKIKLIKSTKDLKNGNQVWVPVAHTYNPSYLGGRDQKDCGLKPTLGKRFTRLNQAQWYLWSHLHRRLGKSEKNNLKQKGLEAWLKG